MDWRSSGKQRAHSHLWHRPAGNSCCSDTEAPANLQPQTEVQHAPKLVRDGLESLCHLPLVLATKRQREGAATSTHSALSASSSASWMSSGGNTLGSVTGAGKARNGSEDVEGGNGEDKLRREASNCSKEIPAAALAAQVVESSSGASLT